jgi:UDP-2-acetamido-3-amino-2,3-dideoxy-glucuronate N-acetyltransferase
LARRGQPITVDALSLIAVLFNTHGDGAHSEVENMTRPAPPFSSIADDVKLGHGVAIYGFVNLYGCEIGDEAKIGAFVEIQKNAKVGKRCKVSSHSFICEGVVIEDECFIGHHVVFTNDRYPAAVVSSGALQTEADWQVVPTRVCRRASIGSGAVILCGVTIGEGALVGAGSVVTKDVLPHTIVAGNPARVLRKVPAAPLETQR